MLLNFFHKKGYRNGQIAATAIFYFILCIGGVSSLARVENNLYNKRRNAALATGYRPAHQQPFVYNHNNHTFGQQQQWNLYNNRSTQYQQPIATLPNQTSTNWTQSNYARNQTRPSLYPAYGQVAFNQSRPTGSQSSVPKLPSQAPYPTYGQGSFNQNRPTGSQPAGFYTPQNPAYGQVAFNQSRPTGSQTSIPKLPNQTPYPAYGQGSFNQSRPASSQPATFYTPQNPAYYGRASNNQSHPAWPQPSASHPAQNPAYSQSYFNQTRPIWSQPSAPLLPNNPQNPVTSNLSNLYPPLPNQPNSKPAVPPSSWSSPANQTLLYPQLPNQNMPQKLPAGSSNDISLAPLQPQPNLQGPHNWHSGGQSALSYGPGHYPPPGDNLVKPPSNRQGSSNPYANMFI